MPDEYYTINGTEIPISGMNGYVEVQLSDAFFNDPKAITNTYVIPLRLTDEFAGVDSVLRGEPIVDNPWRLQASDWSIAPQDYVLYLVKFISPWSGNFLRRGVDVITENGETSTNIRHEQYIENDEIYNLATQGLNTVRCAFDENCNLILTFNEETKECTIATDNVAYSVSGSGKYVSDVAEEVWGEKVRDVIYLDYTVTTAGKTVATKDTLVARDRGVSGTAEEFSYIYNAQ